MSVLWKRSLGWERRMAMARHECLFLPPRRRPSLSTAPLKVCFGRQGLSASLPRKPTRRGSDCHPNKAWWGLMASRPSALGRWARQRWVVLDAVSQTSSVGKAAAHSKTSLVNTHPNNFLSFSLWLTHLPIFIFPGITFQIDYLPLRL